MLCLVRTTVAKNPSPSDAANTAVRYMLRKAGSLHLPSMYDTTRSWGKEAWDDIVSNTFAGRCAYCGRVGQALQVEHLLMTNRTQVGIHHPGNTVPTCKPCNTRSRKKGSQTEYDTWDEHLQKVCNDRNDREMYDERRNKILHHMNESQYKLPMNNDAAISAVKMMTGHLYTDIAEQCKRAVSRYEELLRTFVD